MKRVFMIFLMVLVLVGCEQSVSIDSEDAIETTSNGEEKFNSLTDSDKKEITIYIERRYAYYDQIEGEYAGDKYTNKIWKETASKYGINKWHVDQIWSDIY